MRRTTAAVLGAGALMLGSTAPALAGSDNGLPWQTGETKFTTGFVFNPITGGSLVTLTGSYAANQASEQTERPRVGEVFYIKGSVANVSPSTSEAPILSFVFDEAFTDHEFAISPQNPVECYHGTLDAPDRLVRDGNGCSQSPLPAGTGVSFYSRPLDPGERYEVRVPIKVGGAKSGIASGGAAKFGVNVKTALGGEALAEQHLFVFADDSAAAPGTARILHPGRVAKVRRNRGRIRLRCAAGASCRGVARLQSAKLGARAKNGKKVRLRTYGVRRFRLAGGRTSTLPVKLNARGRKLLRGRSARKVWLNVRLTGGKTYSRRITLRR